MCTNPKLQGQEFFIAGSSGFIGAALAQGLVGSRTASRSELDLSAPNLSKLGLGNVRYGVLASGITSIRRCEEEPQATRLANVDGTLELARQLAGCGLKVIWFSSDYVFDGCEGAYIDEAPLFPLNEYGRQKAEVETRLPEITRGNCLILRLGKTYGLTPGDGTLLTEMASLLMAGKPVRAATDQTMNPTWVGDVVSAVHVLAPTHTGVVNCCSKQILTRMDVALQVAESLGADASLVKPISLDDLQEPFVRPKDTGLVRNRLPRDLSFLCLEHAATALAREVCI